MPDLDATMRALSARTRREILALVWDRDLTVGEIAGSFPLTVATISEHLAVLREAGLVEVTRDGTFRRYRAQTAALTGLHGALEGSTKWRPAEDLPEQALATTTTHIAVTVVTDVPTPPATTFSALIDADLYSRWLGVPVTIEDGRFAATLEWGTEVRGRYDVVVPPQLLAMSWDFEDDNVPVPGKPLIAYLRVHPSADGSRVEVHQLVETAEQAAFMEGAWAMVLGRLKANVVSATSGTTRVRRARRTKSQHSGARVVR
jgi:DNA-binding transcriptional ArsR family regulator